jgi:formylglycine-generating enzyme required for sulfatase activity
MTEAVEPGDRPQTVAAGLPLLPDSGGGLPSFTFETVRVNRQGKIIEKIPGQARFYPQDLGQGVRMDMVQVPGGTFLMGAEEAEIEQLGKKYNKDWFSWEIPQHSVQVSSFFIGKTPVTQDQWRTVVTQVGKIVWDLDPDPSDWKGGNRPVEQVSWYDAVEWCARLSKLTGKEYRLPSEAEWEYACRGGTTTPFAFGEALTTDLANYDGNYTIAEEAKGQYREETTPVASFHPNSFGLYDCHGNVWEWCFDPFHENYQGAPRDGRVWDETIKENENLYQKPSANLNVLLEESDKKYLLRGGSWYDDPIDCRSALRDDRGRDYLDLDLGFRVCLVGAGLL